MSTMTPEQARAILIALPGTRISATRISSPTEYIDTDFEVRDDGLRRVLVDGQFTADELEALAMWLRDPVAVGDANT